MIEDIERQRRNMEAAKSDVVRNHFARNHQMLIRAWRSFNTLKAVTK